jgi:hypothetical protein
MAAYGTTVAAINSLHSCAACRDKRTSGHF